jgi:hypothetical protein
MTSCTRSPYTPPRPDVAVCPTCGTEVPAVAPDATGLQQAGLFYDCPACGQEWSEHRSRGICTRLWTPGERGRQPA